MRVGYDLIRMFEKRLHSSRRVLFFCRDQVVKIPVRPDSALIQKIIQHRLAKFKKDAPRGYLTRDAKAEDLKTLPILKGHVQPGQYITKFRHVFTHAEMNEDLELVAARVGNVADVSEHEESLRAFDWGGGRGRPFGGLPGLGVDKVRPPQ